MASLILVTGAAGSVGGLTVILGFSREVVGRVGSNVGQPLGDHGPGTGHWLATATARRIHHSDREVQ